MNDSTLSAHSLRNRLPHRPSNRFDFKLRLLLLRVLKFVGFSLALTANSHAAVLNKCAQIFQSVIAVEDTRYGKVDQFDPKLIAKGLATHHESNLCGPACLYDVVEKVRGVQSGQRFGRSDADELAKIALSVVPKSGVSVKELTETGMTSVEVAHALALIFKHEHINAEITVQGVRPRSEMHLGFNAALLRASTFDHRAAIIKAEFLPSPKASRHDQTRAHFFVVHGFDAANSSRYFLTDPSRPSDSVSATVTPMNDYQRAQYRGLDLHAAPLLVRFENPLYEDEAGFAMITEVIFVELK